jgi:cytidylate kinase
LIIGQISCGKSTLANRLTKELGLKKASFGGYLIDYCERNGIADKSRESLQAIGQQYIDDDPYRFLQAVIDFSATGSREVVFEGVRHRAIFEAIRQLSKDFISVYLEATYKQRLDRYLTREKNIDIEKIEAEFAKINEHLVEQEVPQLKQYCNHVIDSADNPDADYFELKRLFPDC